MLQTFGQVKMTVDGENYTLITCAKAAKGEDEPPERATKDFSITMLTPTSKLQAALTEITDLLRPFSYYQSDTWSHFKSFFRPKPFAGLEQGRAYLAHKYGGKQFWVKRDFSVSIDCMIIPHRRSGELDRSAPTIILCNPNAITYEYINLQSEYLDFYTQNGVNVVVWNYRGFGRSSRGWFGLSMEKL